LLFEFEVSIMLKPVSSERLRGKLMSKIDYRKELKNLYSPSAKEVAFVDVPKMNFIMIDGIGNPSNSQYKDGVEALFVVSYGCLLYTSDAADE